MSKIDQFCKLVLETSSHNVDKKYILKKHVEHSLILSQFSAKKVLDVGSGCGWTSIIYAIQNPKSEIHFLERNKDQITFIENACNILNITNCTKWTQRQSYDLVINKMLGNWKDLNFIIKSHTIGTVDLVALDNAITPAWVTPCEYTVLGNVDDVNIVGAVF